MKKFLLCISLIAISISSFAQSAPKSLLWRVSKKDIKASSYLFGTIHIICPDDYLWTKAMQTSLDKSEEVCLEMDLDDPGLAMEIAMGMINTSGKSLEDYFTTEEYKKLDRFITDSIGMQLSMFRQMKPAALQALLATKTVNCDNPVSYEANIMEQAQKQGKNITGLETAAQQIDLFDNLPADSVVKDINESINSYEEVRAEYRKLVNLYKQQDLQQIHKLMQESKDIDLGGFLDSRNEKWIGKMTELMDQHATFFAVGAGHLWGDKGLIQLLKKEGYTVEPVK